MRILHLSSEPSWRGGEQQIAYLIDGLNKRGVSNFIACRTGSAFAQHCQKEGWLHYMLPFKNAFDLKTAWALKRICQREQVALVHIHSAKSQGIATLSATLGNSTPLVLSRRVDFPIRQNRLTQWKYNHPQIVKIICISHTIETIVRSAILRPERCVTVHSGIAPDRFLAPTGYLRNRFNIPTDTLLIGNTSALADHKDYFTFIDTARKFTQSGVDAKFVMIGDGPQRNAIKAYIQQHQLSDYVLMTGFVSNVSEVLPELDIFLMTSKTEGLGTSVLDAFACRVPVVATRAGGIPEMVIHEETGLLANIGDSETLANHLVRVSQNVELKRTWVEAAYQHLLQNFTDQRMAQETVKVYQSVVADSAANRVSK